MRQAKRLCKVAEESRTKSLTKFRAQIERGDGGCDLWCTTKTLTVARDATFISRAERYQPIDVFGDDGPMTNINGNDHRIVNLSRTGLAAYDREKRYSQQDVGSECSVQMVSKNKTLLSAQGKLSRVAPNGVGNIVGIQITDQPIDIASISMGYKSEIVRSRLSRTAHPDISSLPDPFKLVLYNTLYSLKTQKAILESSERELSSSLLWPTLETEILDLAFKEVMPTMRDYWRTANTLIRGFTRDKNILDAAKSLTERTITPELMTGAIWQRLYNKPLGYPGDYLVMQYVYDGKDQGVRLYDKLVHRMGVEMLGCVSTRNDMAKEIISQEISRLTEKTKDPIKVMNVACGGAQEIYELLTDQPTSHPLHVTLVDQDAQALSFAQDRLLPVSVSNESVVNLNFLHCSFVDLMLGGPLFEKSANQHLIYSLGFFDYIRSHRAKKLIRTLYDILLPGGLLVVGALADGEGADRLSSELICDWSMIFRERHEMAELAEGLGVQPNEILLDNRSQVYIMLIRKPE